MPALDARINPAAAQAALDAALNQPAPSAVVALPDIDDAPDTTVRLIAGWYDPSGGLHTEAEVRELTGADEEALAKVKGSARMLQAILSRAVVSIGGQPATEAMIDQLLVGDGDALLLGIRAVTFGPDVELEVLCPHCQTKQSRKVDLREIPVTPLDGFRDFDVQLKVGLARVVLPTTKTGKKLANGGADRTGAELNTLLLSECVTSIGEMAVSPDRIRRLGLRDRQLLLTELGKRLIGPRLEEVSLPCTSCSESIALPLEMADLFRL